jgi:hypothetical protein
VVGEILWWAGRPEWGEGSNFLSRTCSGFLENYLNPFKGIVDPCDPMASHLAPPFKGPTTSTSPHWGPTLQHMNPWETRYIHSTVDPWHLQVCGSKETTTEEKMSMLRVQLLCWGCLIHFFPQCHLTSCQVMQPFSKSQIFTWSILLSTLTFTCFLGYHLLFWKADFHKIKGREIVSRSYN